MLGIICTRKEKTWVFLFFELYKMMLKYLNLREIKIGPFNES